SRLRTGRTRLPGVPSRARGTRVAIRGSPAFAVAGGARATRYTVACPAGVGGDGLRASGAFAARTGSDGSRFLPVGVARRCRGNGGGRGAGFRDQGENLAPRRNRFVGTATGA